MSAGTHRVSTGAGLNTFWLVFLFVVFFFHSVISEWRVEIGNFQTFCFSLFSIFSTADMLFLLSMDIIFTKYILDICIYYVMLHVLYYGYKTDKILIQHKKLGGRGLREAVVCSRWGR